MYYYHNTFNFITVILIFLVTHVLRHLSFSTFYFHLALLTSLNNTTPLFLSWFSLSFFSLSFDRSIVLSLFIASIFLRKHFPRYSTNPLLWHATANFHAMAPHLWSCFSSKGSNRRDGIAERRVSTADVASESSRGGGGQGAVVVEMFSSQGCATSPEAELVLSRLGRGDFELEVPVVVLIFHVDYWDYVGWKDPFGSSQWTVRQKAYVEALGLDTIFTPQVVVQGKAHCIGNDENALIETITNAPRFPAPTLQVRWGYTFFFKFPFCIISLPFWRLVHSLLMSNPKEKIK